MKDDDTSKIRPTCVEVLEVDGVVVFDLVGEIDLYSVTDLDTVMHESISGGARRIVVDATKLKFIDSSGLRSLVVGYREMNEVHGALAVAVNARVARTLRVGGVHKILTLHETRDEALREVLDGSNTASS